jgi:hypothetical protein
MDIPLLFSPRIEPPILELEFLSAQYTMEDPKNHMVFEPRLLLWDGGFPLELLWGFKRVLLVVPID